MRNLYDLVRATGMRHQHLARLMNFSSAPRFSELLHGTRKPKLSERQALVRVLSQNFGYDEQEVTSAIEQTGDELEK